jgi:hypothetical protein
MGPGAGPVALMRRAGVLVVTGRAKAVDCIAAI